MSYQVFQGDTPADAKHTNIDEGLGWDTSVFDNFDEAVIYAHKWAYPVFTGVIHKMEVGVPVNMSMYAFKMMMVIEECDEQVEEAASPDLLDVVQRLLAYITKPIKCCGTWKDLDDEREEKDSMCKAAKAAIAKALELQ